MKKILLSAAGVALILLLLLTLTSCEDGLKAPTGLSVDVENVLTWEQVDGARAYVVRIKDSEGNETFSKKTKKLSYSLSDLKEGDYEISIQATGKSDDDGVSEWSTALKFHRNYETGCVYELINNNSEYRIAKAGSASGKVIIEDIYRGKPVTSIGDDAFKGNKNITEVVLGKNVREIGENSFYNCLNLVSLELPDGITKIGDSAFQGCRSLEKVNIPKGISVIPEYCFAYCRSLSSITIDDNITTISQWAFNGTALKSVVIPDSVTSIGELAFATITSLEEVTIGKNVVTIGDSAFRENPVLESVTFAEGSRLETLGSYCFRSNPMLKSVSLPSTVKDIQLACFYDCPMLESVSIPDEIQHIGTRAFNATKIFTDSESDFVYVGKWLVAVKNLNGVVNITKNDIRPGTLGISDSCFKQAPLLETVQLPDSIKTVGRYAFAQAYLLTKFEAGSDLEILQEGAFNACTTLITLNLNDSLKVIEKYTFLACTMLDNNAQRSIIPKSVERIGAMAFMNTQLWSTPDENHIIYAGSHRSAWVVGYDTETPIGSAKLKSGVVGIADYAFQDCTTVTSLEGLSSCLYIGVGAFSGCEKLEAVSLHPRITEIKDLTFYKCSSLFKISFPTMLESVGVGAFYKCTNLSELDFSTTINFKKISQFGFYGCQNLKTIEFGDDSPLEDIGECAFMYCSSLGEIKIPVGIKEIKDYTFSHCRALQSFTVTIPEEGNVPEGYTGITKIGMWAFYKCYNLREAIIPDTVESIGERAFYKCNNITTLKLGSSVKSIGDYAFYKAASVKSLHIPDSVVSIGQFAFRGLVRLNSVIIPKSVETLNVNAFYGCNSATFYVEDGTDTEGWNLRWNSSNRPVVYGAILSENRTYVSGIKVAEKAIDNPINLSNSMITPITPPDREGYSFSRWQRADGTFLNTYEIPDESAGSVLTAVWKASE